MASNRITGRLRLRRFLRNPVTVAVFYALFIFSFSYIGSKTFWTHYYIWEVPSLAFGAASSLGILTLVSIFLMRRMNFIPTSLTTILTIPTQNGGAIRKLVTTCIFRIRRMKR